MRILLIMLTFLVGLNTPALAYGDCAAGVGRNIAALLKGANTAFNLVNNAEKSGSDVYILLADAQTGISPVAKLSTFSASVAVMNCAALEAANPHAGELRIRWSKWLQVPVTKVTSDRVQAAFTARLKAGGVGQNTLLTADERQLIADTLSATCTYEGAICADTRRLAAKLQLPPPSRHS